MRLSTTLVACVALSWPMAASGRTPQAEPPRTSAVQAGVGVADSATAAPSEPSPSEYVEALTREALDAHLSVGRQQPEPAAEPGVWQARLGSAIAWGRSAGAAVTRLARRPAVRTVMRTVLLPLLLLISTVAVVWRLGTSRGREEALRATTGRIRAVRDLAAGGAHVPDIARRTHVGQEGVSLAMRLGNRRSEVIR